MLYVPFSNNIFDNTLKIDDIYVSTTWYLFQQINIQMRRNNTQHSMLALFNINNIAIDNYKQEIFRTFMLADGE